MDLSTFLWYLRAAPLRYVIASTIAMALRSSLEASSTVWLTWWSEDATREDQANSATFRVIVYAIIGVFYGIVCGAENEFAVIEWVNVDHMRFRLPCSC